MLIEHLLCARPCAQALSGLPAEQCLQRQTLPWGSSPPSPSTHSLRPLHTSFSLGHHHPESRGVSRPSWSMWEPWDLWPLSVSVRSPFPGHESALAAQGAACGSWVALAATSQLLGPNATWELDAGGLQHWHYFL